LTLAPGSYAFVATYQGNDDFAASDSASLMVVVGAPPPPPPPDAPPPPPPPDAPPALPIDAPPASPPDPAAATPDAPAEATPGGPGWRRPAAHGLPAAPRPDAVQQSAVPGQSTPPASTGGCSCRTTPSDPGSLAWLAIAALGVALRIRRPRGGPHRLRR